jgi:hypothetical protein
VLWTEARDSLLTTEPTSPRALQRVEAPGIYAWWDQRDTLGGFWPEGFPAVDTARPLYVGIAKTNLKVRGADMHLKSTRVSTIRRSLTALLHGELGLLPGATPDPRRRTKYRLTPQNEVNLTRWIESHLTVTWVMMDDPGAIEKTVVGDLLSPLNDEFAHHGPYWQPMSRARDAVIDIIRR